MGVTRVNLTALPKNPLELNLPGMRLDQGRASFVEPMNVVPLDFAYYNLQIPQNTADSSYPAWIAARKT